MIFLLLLRHSKSPTPISANDGVGVITIIIIIVINIDIVLSRLILHSALQYLLFDQKIQINKKEI